MAVPPIQERVSGHLKLHSDSLLLQSLDKVPEVILLLDMKKNILYANPSAIRESGVIHFQQGIDSLLQHFSGHESLPDQIDIHWQEMVTLGKCQFHLAGKLVSDSNMSEPVVFLEKSRFNDDDLVVCRISLPKATIDDSPSTSEMQLNLSEMIEYSKECFCRFDREGKLLDCTLTKGCEELFGKNLNSGDYLERIHPGDRDMFRKVISEVAESGMSRTFKYRSLQSEQPSRWIQAQIHRSSQKDSRGDATLIQIARDITARHHLEEQLKSSRNQIELAFHAASDGLYEFNHLTKYIYFSPKMFTMLGYEPQAPEVSYEFISNLIHPDDVEVYTTRVMEHIENRTDSYVAEIRLKANDGQWKHILSRGRCLEWDENGNAVHMVGTHSDITELKRAEAALRDSEERYRTLAETATDLILTVNIQGEITYANRATCRFAGKKLSELQNSSIYNLVAPEFVDSFIHAIEKNKDNKKKVTRIELDLYSGKKGNSPFEVSTSLFHLTDLRPQILVIARDITERKRVEIELKKAKEEAEAGTQAKSQFLANMSHEIRTPMNAILGFSEILEKKIEDENLISYLAAIRSSGKSLLRLINDILDLSKVEAGRLELELKPVHLIDVLQEIQQIASWNVREKGIDFHLHIPSSIPPVLMLDEIRFRQILLNLLGNAIKFTDEGSITLEVRSAPSEEDNGTIDLFLTVSDTGVGIPQDQQDIIFQAFQQRVGQSSSQYGGTGLGLAITLRLVEMMNGTIHVSSSPGVGSSFEIVLRNITVTTREMAGETLGEFDYSSICFAPSRILIVDDVESNRVLMREYLNIPGLSVDEAVDGRQALQLLNERSYNLIFMDMKMPGLDGVRTTHKLKNDPFLKNVPLVAVTAAAMKEDKERFLHLGCDGYLKKPLSHGELVKELIKHLEIVHDQEDNETESTPKKTETTTEPDEILITVNTRSLLPELLRSLQSDFQPRWESLKGKYVFDEIIQFARDIKHMGTLYDFQPLEQWGNLLLNQAENFDMERLPMTLNQFPERVNDILKLL